MEPSVDSAPAFHQYSLLPYELRRSIIEEFLERRGRWAGHAQYASVNLQWKSVVEKLTFQSLTLQVADPDSPEAINDKDDLDDFQRICINDRTDLVFEIWLRITLGVPRDQHTESSPSTTVSIPDQGSSAVNNDLRHPSALHAGPVATEAFCRLFRILQNWSRDRNLLKLTYTIGHNCPLRSGPSCSDHVRIDSSSFPEVRCIGSLTARSPYTPWVMQPASAFHLLAKLPNATRAKIDLHEDLELPEVVEMLQEGQSTLSSQGPRLKHLEMWGSNKWCKALGLGLNRHHSIQFHQSMYAISSGLEVLYLDGVVNAPFFLRQPFLANGSTPQGLPAWPNLRKLWVSCTIKTAPHVGVDEKGTYDSITHALPQMPNMTSLYVQVMSDSHKPWHSVRMQVPPRRDRSAMPDARLSWYGIKPDAETVDTWKEIVRSQWYCRLVVLW